MSDQTAYQLRLALVNAQIALQQKNKMEARKWATEAIRLAPENEEAWLILAAISSPSASVAYLQKVLQINPKNERAVKGLKWATTRLEESLQAVKDTQNQLPQIEKPVFHPIESFISDAQKSPEKLSEEPVKDILDDFRPKAEAEAKPELPPQPISITDWIRENEAETAPEMDFRREFNREMEPEIRISAEPAAIPVKTKTPSQKSKGKGAGYSWGLTAILLLILISSAVVVRAALPGLTALARSSAAPIPGDKLGKPSLTPTLTNTPTSTLTPTPTNTPTSTATFTPTPTETPLPSATPYPTSTPQPYPTSAPVSYTDISGHWIDVDLSEQRLYAYDGDTLVDSFLVSTGVAAHPTVTGSYAVYVKYLSTTMAGPGYYLTDVPYTMYFYKGYGIHGTYWHNNFGTPMSHGCINMKTSEAKWVYDFSEVGTTVVIHQ